MLRMDADGVEREARKCLDAAMAGGGYILSTGDQCGRDTPDENITRLVEVCEKYGRYR
jgi:uroporphyrinogen decarboxylase